MKKTESVTVEGGISEREGTGSFRCSGGKKKKKKKVLSPEGPVRKEIRKQEWPFIKNLTFMESYQAFETFYKHIWMGESITLRA